MPEPRYLRALKRLPVDTTPVWIMRQAGRYLPEYRATREKAGSFMRLCQTPELACEVTLQPLRRYPLDAAIIFSDILTIPDAMGLGLSISEGEGPRFARPLRRTADVQQLKPLDMQQDLNYVLEAIRMTRAELPADTPLIGFSGSPWTLAAYMVDGAGGEFPRARRLLYEEPALAHTLLAKLIRAVTDYLCAQAAAGAQSLMIFDSWGGLLSPVQYREFSLGPMQKVVQALKTNPAAADIPITLFGRGNGWALEALADTGCDALGLDWTVPLDEARARVGARVALQGNLDPAALFASKATVVAETHRVLDTFGQGPGHIFNLGHGIRPQVNPDRLAAVVETVHQHTGKG